MKNELQKMEMEICGRKVEGGYQIENTFIKKREMSNVEGYCCNKTTNHSTEEGLTNSSKQQQRLE